MSSRSILEEPPRLLPPAMEEIQRYRSYGWNDDGTVPGHGGPDIDPDRPTIAQIRRNRQLGKSDSGEEQKR